MEGSVTVSSPPTTLKSFGYPQKNEPSLARNVLRKISGNCDVPTKASRCLFGPPDITEAKDLVKQVELQNALKFGKHFNFDIVSGEPFPFSNSTEATEKETETKEDAEETEGYFWNEKYSPDHLEISNKNALNRQVTWSLFIAPITLTCNITCTALPSPPQNLSSENIEITPVSSANLNSSDIATISHNSPGESASPNSSTENIYSETNNNDVTTTKVPTSAPDTKTKRNICKQKNPSVDPSTKPISKPNNAKLVPTARYINRIVKHAVTKRKSRRSVITGYLPLRRTRSGRCQSGKKQKLRELY